MSTYVPLGNRTVTGGPDSTGFNSGNWTVVFDPNALNINVPIYECYQITVTGAPGSTFTVFVDLQQWSQSNNGQLNAWDPSQPLYLRPGQTVYFYYSDPDTDGIPPVVTMWFRYDQDIVANQKYASVNY
jgi:hypothetical protein